MTNSGLFHEIQRPRNSMWHNVDQILHPETLDSLAFVAPQSWLSSYPSVRVPSLIREILSLCLVHTSCSSLGFYPKPCHNSAHPLDSPIAWLPSLANCSQIRISSQTCLLSFRSTYSYWLKFSIWCSTGTSILTYWNLNLSFATTCQPTLTLIFSISVNATPVPCSHKTKPVVILSTFMNHHQVLSVLPPKCVLNHPHSPFPSLNHHYFLLGLQVLLLPTLTPPSFSPFWTPIAARVIFLENNTLSFSSLKLFNGSPLPLGSRP